MISAMHVRILQSGCTLASLTDAEMFWKHHWAWHTGPASSTGDSRDESSAVSPTEKRLQSVLDRAENQIRNSNRGGRRGGRGSWGRSGRGQKRNSNSQSQTQDGKGASQFNTQIPPKPNGRGGKGQGKSAGQAAWQKRAKKGR